MTSGRRNESQRGSNLVEAAIIVPLLLLMLAGVVDFGRAFFDYIAIANASREGARAAAKLPCFASGPSSFSAYWQAVRLATRQAGSIRPGESTDVVLADADIKLFQGATSTQISSCPPRRTALRVTVSHRFRTILGGLLRRDTLTLTTYTEMSRVGPD